MTENGTDLIHSVKFTAAKKSYRSGCQRSSPQSRDFFLMTRQNWSSP